MRFNAMVHASSLLIDKAGGEQLVRAPRRWDAIGALLQRVYAVRRTLPDPLARLVPRIDAGTQPATNPAPDPMPDEVSVRR